jgi:hypothetical protein
MTAIADYFHTLLGYNVYLPLLQCHGLKNPEGMAGVSLGQWKKNVRFAVKSAGKNADLVSIGGLSMGGALAFSLGCTDQDVSGDIYLFSAALGLASGPFGLPVWLQEFLLRSPLNNRFFQSKRTLVGNNPYRYELVSLNSAGELAHLIVEIKGLLQEFKKGRSFYKRVFSAWSEFDNVVSLEAIRGLNHIIPETNLLSFVLPKAARVDHACVVLKEPVHALDSLSGGPPLEEANALFSEMMTAISQFEFAGSRDSL